MIRTISGSLFDLAPSGVYKLSRLPKRLVVSYTTLSALLVICFSKFISGLLSVALSISLWIPPVRRHLCSAVLGLSSLKFRATTRLTQTVKKLGRLKGLIEKTKDEMFTINIMVIYRNKGSDCKHRNYKLKRFSGLRKQFGEALQIHTRHTNSHLSSRLQDRLEHH